MERRSASILSGCIALCACSPGQDVGVAEQAIAGFHKQLDAGQFAAIYAASSTDMKGASPETSLVPLLAAVHRKLGNFQSGKTAGWNDNHTTSGHFVTVNFAATYQKGKANENFVYRIENGKAELAGYHISSDALILN